MEKRQTIYQELIAAGCEVSNHYSDLYVKATPAAVELVKDISTRSTFRNQIDGEIWFDIPFAFDPFWEEVERKAAARQAGRPK